MGYSDGSTPDVLINDSINSEGVMELGQRDISDYLMSRLKYIATVMDKSQDNIDKFLGADIGGGRTLGDIVNYQNGKFVWKQDFGAPDQIQNMITTLLGNNGAGINALGESIFGSEWKYHSKLGLGGVNTTQFHDYYRAGDDRFKYTKTVN